MSHLINQRMNDEAVYRTAPATPGLLKIVLMTVLTEYFQYYGHLGSSGKK